MLSHAPSPHVHKSVKRLEWAKATAQWIAVILLLLIYLHSHGWAQGVKPTGANEVVTAIQANGANFHITCDAGCGGAASFSDSGAFTAGSTAINIDGGLFDDTPPTAITAGKAAAFRITNNRALHINLRNQAGTEIGTVSNPVQTTFSNTAIQVSNFPATQPVSGTVGATQSGTWTVQPGNTANTTAWKVDGSAVTQPISGSVTAVQALGANLHVNCDSGCGGAAADTTASGSLGAINNAVQVSMAGTNSASFTLPSGNNLVGTLVAESSSDGGTTWQSTILRSAAANNVWQASTAVSSTNAAFNIQVPGGASHVRVRVSAYTSGTATAGLRAVTQPDAVPDPLVQGTQAAGSAVQPNPVTMGGWDGAAARTFKTDSSGVLQMNVTGLNVACAGLPALTGDITSGSGSCATTLASTLAGLKTFTTGITTKSLNGSVFVSQFASLQAAINNFASGNGTIYIDQNISLSSTTTITGSQPNLTFVCTNGATITSGVNVQFNINGANTAITGCHFIGQGPAVATKQAIVVGVDTFTFVGNIVEQYGPNGCNGVIELAFSKVIFMQNRLFNNGDTCGDVFVNNVTASATITDFIIAQNEMGELTIHASANNSLIKHVVVVGNDYHSGQNSKILFCEEIGDFSATQAIGHVADVVTSGNHCYATASGTNGGFSLIYINGASESADLFDAQGFTFTIASFEHGWISNSTITGTISVNGTGGNGLTCDRCTNSTFSNNVVNGWTTAASGYGLHTLVAATVLPTSSDNTFTGNVFIFPAAGTGVGIWEQCNAVGANCNNNLYTGNHILGPGAAGTCITLENDIGTVTATNIAENSCENLANGINQLGTRTNVQIINNQFNTVTTPYAGTVAGSFIMDANRTFAGFSINQNGFWGTDTYASVTGNRTYTKPDATGTYALLESTQTFSGTDTFSGQANKTGQAAIVASSAAINTTEAVITKTPALAANRLVAGSTIRITLVGTCTSTVANTSTFTLRWGTNGTTADGTVAAFTTSAAATTGTNNGFKAVVSLTVRTAGASATSQGSLDLESDGNIGIVATQNVKVVTGTAFNTTTANGILSIAYKSAATTTTSTFTEAYIEVVNN